MHPREGGYRQHRAITPGPSPRILQFARLWVRRRHGIVNRQKIVCQLERVVVSETAINVERAERVVGVQRPVWRDTGWVHEGERLPGGVQIITRSPIDLARGKENREGLVALAASFNKGQAPALEPTGSGLAAVESGFALPATVSNWRRSA